MGKILLKNILKFIYDDEEKVHSYLINKCIYTDLEDIIKYLHSGKKYSALATIEKCDFCNENIEGIVYKTDGVWIWPTWLEHHMRKHKLEIPKDFVEHLRKNNFQYDRESVINLLNDDQIEIDIE